jgi:hypothetical protein
VGALKIAATAVAFQLRTVFDGVAAAGLTGPRVATVRTVTTATRAIRGVAFLYVTVPSQCWNGTRAASGGSGWFPKQRKGNLAPDASERNRTKGDPSANLGIRAAAPRRRMRLFKERHPDDAASVCQSDLVSHTVEFHAVLYGGQIVIGGRDCDSDCHKGLSLVGAEGLEPPTFAL